MRKRILPILVAVLVTCIAVAIAKRTAIVGLVTAWKHKAEISKSDSSAPGDLQPTSEIFLDPAEIASGGLDIAMQFTGTIQDTNSLEELQRALMSRGRRGLAALRAQLQQLEQAPTKEASSEINLYYQIGTLSIYEGQFDQAIAAYEKAWSLDGSHLATEHRRILKAALGIIALRQGEVDNCIGCVGPSTCIFPIAPGAVHQHQAGSREAIRHFSEYLQDLPGDLRIRWLLNLAYMTLGEYPDKVPPEYFIPLDGFQSKLDVGRFDNVAPLVGLISRGPNLAGGSVFDDFTGDGLPDLFTTSLDADRGASLFVNCGGGKFEDRSESAGLNNQIYALNVTRADFDNDGNLDVLLLRGGWEEPMRLSLLRNTGGGVFEDVTVASGLAEPIATESAAWGDYDNDGLVDVFVCGEYISASNTDRSFDPRNRCRLYHNEGNGKFTDVALTAGVNAGLCAKGCAWGDYDRDGRLDLFVSNMTGYCKLYHNEGGGKFRDVGGELGVTGPRHGFACWFWDYDNDGRLDLYVNDYSSSLADVVGNALNMQAVRPSRPRLYRNMGRDGFREVTQEVGLDRPMMPMGCNFADIDNDGYLDIYLGTGRMFLEQLVPNLMFKNCAGERFEDVTVSSGTGHLQKGHGVSFADWDNDGDLDLFVVAGGAVPGDKSYNVLFQNPGHGNHWLKLRLVGTRTNKAALGATIRAVVKAPDGTMRSIYRTVGNNSSFGGNSLVELIGLAHATNVAELEVSWPVSGSTQVFREINADQTIEITEGNDSLKTVSISSSPATDPAHHVEADTGDN